MPTESRLLRLDPSEYPHTIRPVWADAENLAAHLTNLFYAIDPSAQRMNIGEYVTARVLISAIAIACRARLESLSPAVSLADAIASVMRIRRCQDCQHHSDDADLHYCDSPDDAARDWKCAAAMESMNQRLSGNIPPLVNAAQCPGFTEASTNY